MHSRARCIHRPQSIYIRKHASTMRERKCCGIERITEGANNIKRLGDI